MRLIDADKLIEDGWHLERSGRANKTIGRMSIADVPTAYNLDEVLQRMENEKEDDSHSLTYEHDVFIHGYNSGLNEAIEIVKKGGNV